jgi:hypothetical protein
VFSMPLEQPAQYGPPVINLDHLLRLTDDTGLLQHALFSVPNFAEGYTTDDNARALIVAMLAEQAGGVPAVDLSGLATRYLAFVNLAFDHKTARFRNYLGYKRNWVGIGSEDCHGRALWALGTVIGRASDPGLRSAAGHLFELALPALKSFTSPRAWAFAMLGIQEYLKAFPGDREVLRRGEELAQSLLQRYADARSPGWNWFEDSVAYANARLPQALLSLASGPVELAVATGLESLNWLANVQRLAPHAHFIPIGSDGFYPKVGLRARFDQQPIEAGAMVSACLQALRVTGDARWRKEAQVAFDWFLGRNDLQSPLYDASTGGCRDGLHPDRANENQGAESTLAFLMARLELRILERQEQKQSCFADADPGEEKAEFAVREVIH